MLSVKKSSKMMLKGWFIIFILFIDFIVAMTEVGSGHLSLQKGGERNDLVGKPAPEFAGGSWINSRPIKLSDLKGKVVLLEFWTFGCYNCRNTIPYIKNWYEKYAKEKFDIIGVHSPEFEREKEFSAVVRQTQDLGIKYPVLTDNDLKTWNVYDQEYWPALYLIDKKGIVRYVQIGEGDYPETERWIQNLLKE